MIRLFILIHGVPDYKTFVAGLVVLGAIFLVTSPKEIISTCLVLLSFICALCVVCWRSFTYSLRGVRKRITSFVRKLIFTGGREWLLDETESAIAD